MSKKRRVPYFSVCSKVQFTVECAAAASGEKSFTVALQHDYCTTVQEGYDSISWDAKQLCLDLGLKLLEWHLVDTEYLSTAWHGEEAKEIVTIYDIRDGFQGKPVELRDAAIAKAVRRGLLIPESNHERYEYYCQAIAA
jgi:hypothetical protein